MGETDKKAVVLPSRIQLRLKVSGPQTLATVLKGYAADGLLSCKRGRPLLMSFDHCDDGASPSAVLAWEKAGSKVGDYVTRHKIDAEPATAISAAP